jgi:hypothetical protein
MSIWSADGAPGWSADGWGEWSADGFFYGLIGDANFTLTADARAFAVACLPPLASDLPARTFSVAYVAAEAVGALRSFSVSYLPPREATLPIKHTVGYVPPLAVTGARSFAVSYVPNEPAAQAPLRSVTWRIH